MRVYQLIEKLKELDQEAFVEVYGGYDPEFGECFFDPSEITAEPTGWDSHLEQQIFTVFIK